MRPLCLDYISLARLTVYLIFVSCVVKVYVAVVCVCVCSNVRLDLSNRFKYGSVCSSSLRSKIFPLYKYKKKTRIAKGKTNKISYHTSLKLRCRCVNDSLFCIHSFSLSSLARALYLFLLYTFLSFSNSFVLSFTLRSASSISLHFCFS